MSFAAVDIGNTSINIVVWNDGGEKKFKRHGAFRSVVDIIPFFREEGVESVAYSTTRNLSEKELEQARSNGWWEVTAGSRLPVTIDYATPETLGLDRLMAAAAAASLYPGEEVMIADAGTALTLDMVSAGGVFRGGNISAGLSMRLRALHQFTSRLPEVKPLICEHGHIGHDTISALQYGALWGVAYEIAGNLAYAAKTYGCRRLIVTGGDALFLLGTIMEAVSLLVKDPAEVGLMEDLVVYGLKIAYEYNHDK